MDKLFDKAIPDSPYRDGVQAFLTGKPLDLVNILYIPKSESHEQFALGWASARHYTPLAQK